MKANCHKSDSLHLPNQFPGLDYTHKTMRTGLWKYEVFCIREVNLYQWRKWTTHLGEHRSLSTRPVVYSLQHWTFKASNQVQNLTIWYSLLQNLQLKIWWTLIHYVSNFLGASAKWFGQVRIESHSPGEWEWKKDLFPSLVYPVLIINTIYPNSFVIFDNSFFNTAVWYQACTLHQVKHF